MSKFCTSCGSGLNPDARFCTKCGASVKSESAVQQQSYTQPPQESYTGTYTQPPQESSTGTYTQPPQESYTGTYTQPPQESYTGTYTQPMQQNYTAQYTPPAKSGSGGSGFIVICIVLAALFFLQTLLVLLFGWPGFAVGGKKDRLSQQPSRIYVETKSDVTMDFPSYKLTGGETVLI